MLNPNRTTDLNYRRLVRVSKQASLEHKTTLRIALLSDAATQQFVPVLKALLHENGVASTFYEGSFDAIELETINPASALYSFKPDIVVLLNSLQAFRVRFYQAGVAPELHRITRIWNSIAAHSNCRIIQCNLALPYERAFGQFDLKLGTSLYTAAQSFNSHIAQSARERSNVLICDIESIASYIGRRHWFDDRLWDMSKTFCNLEYLPYAAQAMADIMLAGLGRVVKCIVLDLDNTLWGGIVGDAGPLGVQISNHGDGEPFYRFQQYLLTLKQRGILLAVCSKNDMANALAPFEQNHEMVLKRDDITVFVANWENKADNIRSIRDTLEIGLDSLLFLDDNPFERNLVRNFLPDVIVPELPEDPADYVRAVSELNLFETTTFSAEDVARASLYKQEADRRQAQTAYTDINQFLQSLDMRILVERFPADKIPRIAQLLLRSNQFNLTTHRYSEAECSAMMQNHESCIPLCASLSDRFGDHGLISIVVVWPEDNVLRISDWLMSCRVLVRGVEQYLMNTVFAIARELGLEKVTGEYLPTAKNAMVKNFWAQFGFTQTSESGWELAVNQYNPATVWINKTESDHDIVYGYQRSKVTS